MFGGIGNVLYVGVCECKMDVKFTWINSYMASFGSCFVLTWTVFKNHLLEVDANTKLGDHGTLNAHDRCFILICYHV